MPNFGRPRKIVAGTRRGSARRGRASACAACAACDARAACADRRPAGQHAHPCVRRKARITISGWRTYALAPARARESTRRADCNAGVTAPPTDTLRTGVPTKRITRTTGIDRRRSEHWGPRGLGLLRCVLQRRGGFNAESAEDAETCPERSRRDGKEGGRQAATDIRRWRRWTQRLALSEVEGTAKIRGRQTDYFVSRGWKWPCPCCPILHLRSSADNVVVTQSSLCVLCALCV